MFKVIRAYGVGELERALNTAYDDGFRMLVSYAVVMNGTAEMHCVILKKAAV